MTRSDHRYLRIIGTIFTLAAVGLCVVLSRAYSDAVSLAKKQFNTQQMLVVEQTAVGIQQDIRQLVQEITLLAAEPAIMAMRNGPARNVMQRALLHVGQLHVNDVGLLNAKGRVVVTVNAPELSDVDFSYRRYFQQAKGLDQSTPTYEFITFKGVEKDRKGMIIAMPVFSPHKQFAGVVVFTLKVDELIAGFAPSGAKNGTFWVLDSDGIVLHHPHVKPGTVLADVPNLDASLRTFLGAIQTGRSHRGEYVSPDAVRMIAASRPLRIGGQTWPIVIATPERKLSDLLRTFSMSYLLATVAVLTVVAGASGVIVYLVGRWNRQLESTVESRTRDLAASEEKQRALVETIDDWIWEVDTKARYIYASPRIKDLLGYEPHELIGKTPYSFMPLDEARRIRTLFEDKLARREAFTIDNVNIHRDGRHVVLETSGVPVRDEQGNVVGYRGADRDVTARKSAEQAQLAYQERLETIKQIGALANATLDLSAVLHRILVGTLDAAEASVGMIFLRDQETGHLRWGASVGLSPAFVNDYRHRYIRVGEGLTGRIAETGEAIYIVEDSSHDPRIARPVVEAEGLNSFIGVPVYADDEIVAVMNILTRPPEILGEDKIDLATAVGVHVGTAIRNAQSFEQRKQAEQQITASLEEKESLLQEIHHRVKNNLQLICSLLNLQTKYLADDASRDALRESRNRVRSMAIIHETLYSAKDFRRVNFAERIRLLTANLLRSYGLTKQVVVRVNADEVPLRIDTAVPCGLIVNELVSNCLKHAFPEGRNGVVEIDFRSDGERCTLIVADNGIRFPKDCDFRHTDTLGLQLVGTLIDQLAGTIRLDTSEGTRFTITFPESSSTVSESAANSV